MVAEINYGSVMGFYYYTYYKYTILSILNWLTYINCNYYFAYYIAEIKMTSWNASIQSFSFLVFEYVWHVP